MKRRLFIQGLCLSLLPTMIFSKNKGEKTVKKALILIDFQNDYFENGKLPLNNIDIALSNANLLVTYAQKKEYKIYVIQHISTRDGATFFLANTKGVELYHNLITKNSTLIKKYYPNSFRETVLDEELKEQNISELIICGAMTHMCIDSTVRAGYDLGYKITLANDACATRDLQFEDTIIKAQDVHSSFISALGSVFCDVKDTSDIIKI